MKLTITLYFLVAIFFLNSKLANAQQDTSKTADPSLNGQYLFMLSKSKSLYGAKMINPVRLSELWKSVGDTLKKERKQLKEATVQIKNLSGEVSTLKTEASGKESALANSNAMVNEIKFLGIGFSKTTYNTMVWGIIVLLGLGLAFVIFQSAGYRKEANYRIQLYQEVADEFQAYKTKAKEKEMKLARELQDERNRWDDANGR